MEILKLSTFLKVKLIIYWQFVSYSIEFIDTSLYEFEVHNYICTVVIINLLLFSQLTYLNLLFSVYHKKINLFEFIILSVS